MRKFSDGFTLIELLIVIAIIGILASVAVPSYQQYLQDARRLDAQQFALQQIANLERLYTQNGAYPDASQVPDVTSNMYTVSYTPQTQLRVATNAAAGSFSDFFYTLTLTPVYGTPQAGDRCGVMTINEQGIQAIQNPAGPTDCWQ